LDGHFTGWFFGYVISFLQILDKEKKKLTDIGLFGFHGFGKTGSFQGIWIPDSYRDD